MGERARTHELAIASSLITPLLSELPGYSHSVMTVIIQPFCSSGCPGLVLQRAAGFPLCPACLYHLPGFAPAPIQPHSSDTFSKAL